MLIIRVFAFRVNQFLPLVQSIPFRVGALLGVTRIRVAVLTYLTEKPDTWLLGHCI